MLSYDVLYKNGIRVGRAPLTELEQSLHVRDLIVGEKLELAHADLDAVIVKV